MSLNKSKSASLEDSKSISFTKPKTKQTTSSITTKSSSKLSKKVGKVALKITFPKMIGVEVASKLVVQEKCVRLLAGILTSA